MDEKYDVVKKVASRPAYAIRKFLGGLDMTHEFFTLHGMERQFTDRVEMKLNLGGFLIVALYPEAALLHSLLNRRGDDLVCVEFDNSLRVHISIMGQFTMILVSRKDFLNAIAELGGLSA